MTPPPSDDEVEEDRSEEGTLVEADKRVNKLLSGRVRKPINMSDRFLEHNC